MVILQMGTQELAEYLYASAAENPVIDMDSFSSTAFLNGLGTYTGRERQSAGKNHENTDRTELYEAYSPAQPETLKDHLQFQLQGFKLSKEERQIAGWLIGCVNDKGFLDEDPAAAAALFGTDISMVNRLIALLRSFTPTGVCAANIKDCLLAQIEDHPQKKLLKKIISDHLPDIAQGHFNHISRSLHVSKDEVHEAVQLIKKLSPIPAAGFAGAASTPYVVPDVQISVESGSLKVSLCNLFSPYISVNQFYQHLYKESDDPCVLRYLEEKFKSVDQLIHSVSQRESTVFRCAEKIAARQKDFFLGKNNILKPMSMSELAEGLDLNSSTVSRAIKDKYIICSKGIFPMRIFFTQCRGKTAAKAQPIHKIEKLISELILHEDPRAPLSDQRLCSLLAEKGVKLSRRAVSIYREKAGIPSTFLRKKQDHS